MTTLSRRVYRQWHTTENDVGQPHQTMRVDIGLAIAQTLPRAIEQRPQTYIPDCSSLVGLVCEQ